MPAIKNAEAVRFVNEQVRPLCERARALTAEVNAMQALWLGGVSGVVPNDSSPLDDGRDDEGITRLTGAQVTSAVSSLLAMVAAANAAAVARPCVRPLSAQ